MSESQHIAGNGYGDESPEEKQSTGTLLERIKHDPLSVPNPQSTLIAKDLSKISMHSTPPHPSQIPSRNMVPSASTRPRTRQSSAAFGGSAKEITITMDMPKEQMFDLAKMFQKLFYEAQDHLKRELETLSGICAMQNSQLQQERIKAQAAGVDLEDQRPAGVPSVLGSQVVSRTGSRQVTPSISQQAGNVFANRDPFTEASRNPHSAVQRQERLNSLIRSPTDQAVSVLSWDTSLRSGSDDTGGVPVFLGGGSFDGGKPETSAPISILSQNDDIPPSPPPSGLQTHMAGRTPPPQILHINPSDLSGLHSPLPEALQMDGQIDLPDDPALSGPLTLTNKPDAGLDTLHALDEALAKVANEPEKNPPAVTLSQGSARGTAKSARPQAPKGTEVTATAHGEGTSGTKTIMGGQGSSPSQYTPQMDGVDNEPDIKLKTRTDTTNFGLPLGQVKQRLPSGPGNTRKK